MDEDNKGTVPGSSLEWQVGGNNRVVRRRLLRRIASGEICGVISAYSGKPCLGVPLGKGKPCKNHGGRYNDLTPDPFKDSRAVRAMRLLVADALSPEEACIFNSIVNDSPTLEAEIALARGKVLLIERRYSEGKLKDAAYQEQWRAAVETLRKLVETNQKVRLAERTLTPEDPGAKPDAFDPLAEPEIESDD